MPLKSGIETILNRKFINFSFKAQNSHYEIITGCKRRICHEGCYDWLW